jgi:hypothetical protein
LNWLAIRAAANLAIGMGHRVIAMEIVRHQDGLIDALNILR